MKYNLNEQLSRIIKQSGSESSIWPLDWVTIRALWSSSWDQWESRKWEHSRFRSSLENARASAKLEQSKGRHQRLQYAGLAAGNISRQTILHEFAYFEGLQREQSVGHAGWTREHVGRLTGACLPTRWSAERASPELATRLASESDWTQRRHVEQIKWCRRESKRCRQPERLAIIL